MKKLSVFVLLAALVLGLAGCGVSDGEPLKLCRVEITDLSGQREPVTLEGLSREELNGFLCAEDWGDGEAAAPAGQAPAYRVEVYQDPTKTATQLEDTQPLKILEYVTYEGTDVVKCVVGGEILPQEIVEEFLEHYTVAPRGFFDALEQALAAE